jgi:hypothetical protein
MEKMLVESLADVRLNTNIGEWIQGFSNCNIPDSSLGVDSKSEMTRITAMTEQVDQIAV